MAKETVKDFKTVEETKTIHYCDNCGCESDTLVDIAINPRFDLRTNFDVVKVFDDRMEADKELREINQHKSGFAHDAYPSSQAMAMDAKYGIRKNWEPQNAQATEEIEFCIGCVEEFFDIEIPEDEVVTDIETKKDGITINTTKEVTTIWPQIHHEKWSHMDHVGGWKLKITLWPFFFYATFLDYIRGSSLGDMKRVKGYVAASLGAILWTTIVITTLILTGGIALA